MTPTKDRHRPLDPSEADFPNLFGLQGKRFLVLGAGAGVGEHITWALVAAGAEVMCVDRDEEAVARVAAEAGATAFVADLVDDAAVADLGRAVQRWGRIDGFVDVVGQTTAKPLRVFTVEDWDRDFRVNLRHAFLAAQTLMPLVAPGGSAVFISSTWSAYASPAAPGYGPAKAALNTWVKQLAAEYGADGIRVNAVAPGLFLSPRLLGDVTAGNRDMLDRLASRPLLERLGQPYEVAGVVTFLMTRAAGHMTGVIVPVDGGATVRDPLGMNAL
jgi:NAD(P)-dependent dehydrogenase (short-subunit alcohol dehydrogenase family)